MQKEQRRVSGDSKGSRERSSTEILMRGERSTERERREERGETGQLGTVTD